MATSLPEGHLQPKWQTLTIILGILAIPYQYLKNQLSSFGKRYNEIEDITRRAESRKATEEEHRDTFDRKIHERELRIQLIEERLSRLDMQMENIEMKKEKVKSEVDAMDEQQLRDTFENLFKRKKP
ncbi:MAG: hypothetical protein U5L09_11150 [Bacteroidales bacterium]|nr:hypothetical protein [Bacteroidales bacterium]